MTQQTKATPKVQPQAQPTPEAPKHKFPTEIVDLPSKGIIYPKDNPLSSGKVEMKYMTAREEDIITNQNYISKGIVVDKLLESLIISPINYRDLILGDKNALLVAARVLGYGKDYSFTFAGEEHTVDLSTLDNKPLDESLFTPGINEFEFTLPTSKVDITFSLMTKKVEDKIEQELKGLKKLNKNLIPEMSTRMKHLIVSVDGNRDNKSIREFVDTYLLARDAKALRDYVVKIQPDLDFKFQYENFEGDFEEIDIPINSNFFFPDN
jgi:hypothetical protein